MLFVEGYGDPSLVNPSQTQERFLTMNPYMAIVAGMEIPHSSILRKLRIDSIGMTLPVRGLGGMRRGVLIQIFLL